MNELVENSGLGRGTVNTERWKVNGERWRDLDTDMNIFSSLRSKAFSTFFVPRVNTLGYNSVTPRGLVSVQ